MKKYLFIVLLVWVWGCVDQSDPPLEVEFISINDGDTLKHNSGILVRFNQELLAFDFDAESVDSTFTPVYNLSDTINEQGISFKPSIKKVNNSNFITIDGLPQTFYYDSDTYECLIITISNVFYPDGIGDGLEFNDSKMKNVSILNNDYSVFFDKSKNTSIYPNPSYHSTNSNHYISMSSDQNILKTYLYDSDFSSLISTNTNDNETSYGQIHLQYSDEQDLESGFYGFEVEYDNSTVLPDNQNLRGYFIYLSPN
jgi:hypothetical protein